MVGYWKSDCIPWMGGIQSYRTYMKIQKNSAGQLVYKDFFYGFFLNSSCNGYQEFSHYKDDNPVGSIISQDELKEIKFEGRNKFRMNIEMVLSTKNIAVYRMSSRDFPRYNYTNAE